MSTETDLRDWRDGQTNAERLCAGILAAEGYENVKPQAPLGGPDEKKDLLADRAGERFVCGVFFPPTDQDFARIRAKFVADREGVARHHADRFVFFVNQRLALAQRTELLARGSVSDELYHLERLRAVLDSPKGYGLRLEFLRRAMSVEEQSAFFSTLREDMTRDLLEHERRVESKFETILERTTSILDALGMDLGHSSIHHGDVAGEVEATLGDLTVSQLRLLHRALTDGGTLPTAIRGQLRGVRVWIGDRADPVYEPPAPELVPQKLAALLEWWRGFYVVTSKLDQDRVVPGLARLHYGIVAIHPFLDGNGRLARFLVDQATRELLGKSIARELTEDHESYFKALRTANAGDLSELVALMNSALE